jgi:D-alanyl-D-alanine carboxypeptidase
MHRTLFILWLILLSSCTAIDDSHAVEDTVFNPQLSDALQKTLEKVKGILKSDNISASLYISDRCFWEGAAGGTKQDPDVPVDSDMLFGFGSITKTFVAGIVLQLVEEKKLGLEDPLGNWLPQYPNIDANLTVRQLLNHGSGLDDFFLNESYRSEVKADLERVWLPEDTLKYVGPPLDIGSAPPKYSNTNYILLGMIIEAITGNSLVHELQSRITGPLQLDSTYLPKQDFNPERWADSTNLSSSVYSSVWAAGAIASTPREIAKWSHTLYSGNFLQPASLESMLITEPRRIGRLEIPMGLGVLKLKVEGETAWGHGGRLYPFKSRTFYIPELGLSVAYSYSWTEVGGQPIPGNPIETYISNRPNDISMCFDS